MSTSFQDRRLAAIPRGLASATPLVAVRALGSEIWDADGKRYIDFAAGIAVLNVGHRHPKVIEAVKAQIDRFTHTSFQVMAYEPYLQLAEALNDLAPVRGSANTLLLNSGGEAVEAAVKIARMATGRSAVIAFAGAFHGRTLMATTLTGKVANYKRGFGSMVPEVYHVPFPSPGSGLTTADTLGALDFLLSVDVDPERVAAIIVEPIQEKAASIRHPPKCWRPCARCATVMASCSSRTRFRRASRGPAGCSRSSIAASRPI